MPISPPSWGSFHVFPPVVTRLGAGREWLTEKVENDAVEIFIGRWDGSRWHFTLSGAKIHGSKVAMWDAFVDAIEGAALPFLFWVKTRRFQIQKEQIGTADGTKARFQIRRLRVYEYGPAPVDESKRWEIIRFPWHNYPDILFPSGLKAMETEYVKVWVKLGGVETALPYGDTVNVPGFGPLSWECIREGGVLEFSAILPATMQIFVSCRYVTLCHGADFMPIESEGSAGVWEFASGELYEAKGEADELFAELDATL